MSEKELNTVKKGPVVAPDVALAEVEGWAEFMDIQLDKAWVDENDGKSTMADKNVMIQAIMDGKVTINDEGLPSIIPREGTVPVIFYRPKGAALMAMDKKKENASTAKMFAAMADVTMTSVPGFASMYLADVKICMAIFNLFLA